jgi:SAM-dependent methyltransferase
MVFDRLRSRAREWAFTFLYHDLLEDSPRRALAEAYSDVDPLSCFSKSIAATKIRQVVEFGTAQAVPGRSTHSLALFPSIKRSSYTMVDIKAGPDVDVVADLHSLPPEWTNRYDACVANAVFEHLERPWIAAKEVGRILAPGGVCYISTHQTFPLHAYPRDYFRFSTDALALIFSDAGLEVLAVGYSCRTKIIVPSEILAKARLGAWNEEFPSYALVKLTARKPSEPKSSMTNFHER